MGPPLQRHRDRHPDPRLEDRPPAPPDTDDSLPLWTVAKVLADRETVLYVAVIVKEGALPFTEDEQRLFSALCASGASGLARRGPRARVPRMVASEPPELARDPKVAATVKKVKTKLLKVARSEFEKPSYGIGERALTVGTPTVERGPRCR